LFVLNLVVLSFLLLVSPREPFVMGPIDSDMVGAYDHYLSETTSGSVAVVKVDSLGGDAHQLLRIFGLTDEAHHRGITVVCRVYGVAASAAAFFFVAGCDRRVMGPKAVLIFHEAYHVYSLLEGPPDPKTLQSLENLNHFFAYLMAEHSYLTAPAYEWHVKQGDWYLLGPDAVDHGLADVAQ